MCARIRRTVLGATLLELLVAMALLGALLRLSMPVYASWMAELEQRGAAEALVDALQRADKDFEILVYPRNRHGLGGKQFERKVLEFMKRELRPEP